MIPGPRGRQVKQVLLPSVRIIDHPDRWRGVLLTAAARPPLGLSEEVRRCLFLLKLNVLQLHLTDGPGLAAGDSQAPG